MSPSPFFSVVIPTYNRADLLRESLESVFHQEFRNFEVIVVDDGSTEDLSQVMEEYQDRVTFLRQENAGPGAARNRGAAVARGEYLAFLDSDDLWFPWTLRTQFESIRGATRPSMVLGSGAWFAEDGELKKIHNQPLNYQAFADFFESAPSVVWVGSGALTVLRDAVFRIGGFSERLRNAEDLDLFLRMGAHRGFVAITAPQTFAYRQHSSNSIHDLSGTLRGAFHLIQQERAGEYPGAAGRAIERLQFLTRFLRPPSVAALQQGRFRDGWAIYRASFRWHLRLNRLRYLFGFPLFAVLSFLRAELGITKHWTRFNWRERHV